MSARLPGSRTLRVSRRPSRCETDSHTRPTGFSSLPPPGPAIPVIPTPTSAPSATRAPEASASATSDETAPNDAISPGSTPAKATFAAFEYTTSPPSITSEDPGSSVSRPASSPPVHDSATAIVSPADDSSPKTCWSTVVPSSENSVSA